MEQDLTTPLRDLLRPLGLDLYDVEFASGTLNVTVDRPGGVDLEALTAATHAVSTYLDETDPIPGRYTLDVASPGLERRLRTPEHFARAVGERITVREVRKGQPTRRLEGPLVGSTELSATINDDQLGEVVVALDSLERARTIFHWGSEKRPSPSKGRATATTSKRG